MSKMKDDEQPNSERRGFMLGALAALPAATMLKGCAPLEQGEEDELTIGEQSQALRPHALQKRVARERAHRRKLYDEHIKGENHHDIGMVMATFSPQGEMIFNGAPFRDHLSIAAAHTSFGMSEFPGALAGLKVVEECLYYTDDEVLIEGRIEGRHVLDFAGFPATHQDIKLPYYAFYRFDDNDKLVSERVVMNWAAFSPVPL